MTKEDKELLLKDLSSRLPYGVKIDKVLYGATTLNERDIESFRKGFDDILIPYLRLMSSMTEDEKIEWDAEYAYNSKSYKYEEYLSKMIDWLNAHYFDYRGLIEKGLAIEAPEGMYNDLRKL